MNNGKIIVVGSSNTDMVIMTERLPGPGETILGGDFIMNPGGKGANQAVAARRLGAKVAFVCRLGADMFGDKAVEGYLEEGIDVTYISRDVDKPSGVALITVDSHAENCIVVASGANASLSAADIDNAVKAVSDSDIMLLQLEIPMETVEFAAKVAKGLGVKVILNPAPAPKEGIPESVLENVDLIIPNSTEAEMLSGIHITDYESASDAAKEISSKGIGQVIITLGAKGSLVFDNGKEAVVPSVKVKAVDTTAAGDTFCGAVAVALSEGKTLAEAAGFAAKASAVTVTRMGAQPSIPYREEII